MEKEKVEEAFHLYKAETAYDYGVHWKHSLKKKKGELIITCNESYATIDTDAYTQMTVYCNSSGCVQCCSKYGLWRNNQSCSLGKEVIDSAPTSVGDLQWLRHIAKAELLSYKSPYSHTPVVL